MLESLPECNFLRSPGPSGGQNRPTEVKINPWRVPGGSWRPLGSSGGLLGAVAGVLQSSRSRHFLRYFLSLVFRPRPTSLRYCLPLALCRAPHRCWRCCGCAGDFQHLRLGDSSRGARPRPGAMPEAIGLAFESLTASRCPTATGALQLPVPRLRPAQLPRRRGVPSQEPLGDAGESAAGGCPQRSETGTATKFRYIAG